MLYITSRLLIYSTIGSVYFFFFVRASLLFIDQMVVNKNKILYRGVSAQCTIINPPKPNSRQ